MTTEWQRLPHRPPRRKFDPEVMKARIAEGSRRRMEARRRSYAVLVRRHLDEWDALYRSELAGVHAERGPLPGDEVPA